MSDGNGEACVRRPDRPKIASWKDTLHDMAIQPVQQFRDTTGESATNEALIIDPRYLLHGGKVDGFCIVSPAPDRQCGAPVRMC